MYRATHELPARPVHSTVFQQTGQVAINILFACRHSTPRGQIVRAKVGPQTNIRKPHDLIATHHRILRDIAGWR